MKLKLIDILNQKKSSNLEILSMCRFSLLLALTFCKLKLAYTLVYPISWIWVLWSLLV